MNSRERVIRAIEFEGPDRVPVTHSVLPAALLKYGEKLERIFRKYPSDFGYGYTYTKGQWLLSKKRRYVDEWGCLWVKIRRGLQGQVKGHPLADWKALETYQFPKPPDSRRGYICGSGGILFERMQWLRGFENLMIDLITRRRETYVLRDRIVDYNLQVTKRFLESDVDGIGFGDDWGAQDRLMIKPSLWREFFKPAYKRMFDEVHKAGVYVHFHSDGYIMDIIPDLIEIGVDVLNPQLPVNDIDELGEKFGGKLCFIAGLDRQKILPWGKPEEIVRHAKHAIKALGCYDGGYIGGGEINLDVPLANVEAMYKAFREYGRYPIRG